MNVSKMRSSLIFVLATLMVVTPVQLLNAQPTTATTTVALSATVGESLSVSASPSTMVLPIAPGTYSSPITVTSNWNVAPTSNYTLQLDMGFASTTAALVNGSMNVPSSSIFNQFSTSLSGAVASGGGGGPCNLSTDAFASGIASGAECAAWVLTGVHSTGSDSSTTIQLNASLGATPAAGTYTGTLDISLSAH